MIERQVINGKEASVQYLTANFEPATKEVHDVVKLVFDDGNILFLHKPQSVAVEKANPYHDQLGRFTFANNATFVSIGGIFDKQRQRAKERAANKPQEAPKKKPGEPRTLTLAETKSELRQLFDNGMAMDGGVNEAAQHIHAMSKGRLSPLALAKAMLGEGGGTPENLRKTSLSIHPWEHKLTFELMNGKVHGASVQWLKRDFHFDTGDVHHSFLRVGQAEQGAGVTRKLFKESLALYKDMGMKSISLTANLDLGGYAWARYGFKTTAPSLFKSYVDHRMGQFMTDRDDKHPLTPEAVTEFRALKALLREHINSDDLPRLFTEAQTPHLDAIVRKTPGTLRNPRFATKMLHHHSWSGYIKFNDKEAMRRMEAYVAGGKA